MELKLKVTKINFNEPLARTIAKNPNPNPNVNIIYKIFFAILTLTLTVDKRP